MTSCLAIGLATLVYSILLNVPAINYHPMNPLPSIASSNIADLFTKPTPRHRYTQLFIGIGVDPATPLSASADSVTTASTVVASAPTTTLASDSVPFNPNLDPAPLPVIDTGAPHSVTSFASDFALEVSQASYGLIRSAFDTSSDSVAYDSKAYSKTLSNDPCTLITGEDAAFDLSFPDSDLDSVDTVEFASTLVYSSFRQFGTAALVFLSDANSKLITILVEPTQVDWIHWVPLPRLTPTESYYHVVGLAYPQAFALFHLIPIWIALVSALLRSE